MKLKVLSIFLLITFSTTTNFAFGNQLQDDLESLTTKLTSVYQEGLSYSENMDDLELSVDIASDEKDTNELKKLKEDIIGLADKQLVLENKMPALKKSLDEYCVNARKDKSETAEAIDALGACEDAESVYKAYSNAVKSFADSRKNIELNLAKFGLDLNKPIPTPQPSESVKPSQIVTSKTSVVKKTTITCLKGKLVKKVTAVNPKCPSGYKKK